MSSGVQTHPGIQEYRNGQYRISTDRSRLDPDLVHRFLTREFWDTEGVPREVVERSIEASLCFGVYDGEQQIGFARVITDRATFAFICDDFIVESHRGRGLGKWLMQCILGHPGLQRLRRIMLVTRDPRLYVKAGFTPLKAPEEYMEIYDPEIYRRGGARQ
jgi:GNAT superfamily N-acetyltransferase